MINEFDGKTTDELKKMIADIERYIQEIYEDNDSYYVITPTDKIMNASTEYFIDDLETRINTIKNEIERRIKK